MSHFEEIMRLDSRSPPLGRGHLFSVPSALEAGESERVAIDVSRYFVGTIGVGRVRSTGHGTSVSEPFGTTLLVPTAGRVVSAPADGIALAAGPGQALVFSPNRRQTRVEPPATSRFAAIPIVVPTADLLAMAERSGARRRSRHGLGAYALHLDSMQSRPVRKLISAVRYVHDAVARNDTRLLNEDVHRCWSRLLTARMVEVLAEAGVFDLPRDIDIRAANRHVRRALDYMSAHFDEITSISEVADACGTSIRTVEIAFREVWAQTPQQALAEIRLAAARRLLVEAPSGESVTDIAFRCGLSHLGRFSVQYRDRYGESPSRTLRRGGASRNRATGTARSADRDRAHSIEQGSG